jgi:hypothetical protein
MAKIVIDANVIISAAFGGKPLRAVILALEDHEVYVSESIIKELLGVFPKLTRKLSEEQVLFIQKKVQQLASFAQHIPVSNQVVLSRHARDDHYLSLCKEIKADFLVTGDKDLLCISKEDLEKNKISCQIITPGAFLEIAKN